MHQLRPPNPQRRSERARQAILDAAFRLSAERGYAQVTVEAIAASAGVGKQTIYRWWRSKGAVVLDALLQAAEPEIGFPDTGDIRADLEKQITSVAGLPLVNSKVTAASGVAPPPSVSMLGSSQ